MNIVLSKNRCFIPLILNPGFISHLSLHMSAVMNGASLRFRFVLLTPLVNMFVRTMSLNLEPGDVLVLSVHQSADASNSCCSSFSFESGETFIK